MMVETSAADLRERDRVARQRAQTVFDRPLFLEAGAGTGKTNTLVARIIAWSMGPGWTRVAAALNREPPARDSAGWRSDTVAARVLQGVVAITFTDAAAAEMATRVGAALAELERGVQPTGIDGATLPASADDRRTRAGALLGRLDCLSVRTIHAFCRRLLATHPLEAGVHPNFQVDGDGLLQAETVRQVVESEVRAAYADPDDSGLLALAELRFGPPEIETALLALVDAGVPVDALATEAFEPQRVQALRGDLLTCLTEFSEVAGDRLRSARRSTAAAAIVETTRQTIAYLDHMGDTRAAVEALRDWVIANWPKRMVDRLADWERGDFNKTETQALGNFAALLAARAAPLRRLIRHVSLLQPVLLDMARQAVHPLLERVYRQLRRRGAETYSGLLRDARHLLERHSEVCAQVRRGIDQLLVDEFQDTDPVQCDIIRRLALAGAADERPGLFLVGDPKQSIYGWRSADLRAYDDFVGDILRCGGERHSLTVNYRSAPAILAEVARVIEPVMCRTPGLQPSFQHLLACDERAANPGFARDRFAPVEYWVSWAWDESGRRPVPDIHGGEATELEAAAMARDIRTLHDEHGIAWQEFGVLLRSTGDLDVYLTALRELSVPYAVERDKGYYQRREIIDAAALVRCVLDPNDQLALLTVLRSALVGVPDAALIPLWSRGLPDIAAALHGAASAQLEAARVQLAGVAENIPPQIPGIDRVRGWEHNLLAALQHIALLRESFECDAADVFVERLRNLSLIEVSEAARHLGEYRAANLDRFFGRLLAALETGRADPQVILRDLRCAIGEARETEEGRPLGSAEDAVRVMTIHKAKGLGFTHVYLMQLHKKSGTERPTVSEAAEHAGRLEYRLFGASTLGFHHVQAQRAAVAAAEQVRTLYVAMTRAVDRLVLAGRWPVTAAPVPSERAKSQVDLLRSRPLVPPDFSALMKARAAAGAAPHTDQGAARWIFPALMRMPADAPPQVPVAAIPATADVALASHILLARRVAASARSARAFHGTASDEAHRRLRELAMHRRYPEVGVEYEAPGTGGSLGNSRGAQRVAMAVGTALHRVLETLDLRADPDAEVVRQCGQLRAALSLLVHPSELELAVRGARDLLERFAAGPLLPRLRALAEHILARELPVLVPPAATEGEPVGFVAGVIDLLYRDPASNSLVIVDYKTDSVESDAEVAERARAYAPQGALYVRALGDALGLADAPRFDLWFLRSGRVESQPSRN